MKPVTLDSVYGTIDVDMITIRRRPVSVRHLLIMTLGLAVLVAAVLLLWTRILHPAHALENVYVSPDPDNMTYKEGGITYTDPNVRHVLKNEPQSDVKKIQMAAYFDKNSVSPSRTITIDGPDLGNPDYPEVRCHAYTPSGNVNNFIQIVMSTSTTDSDKTVTYNIPSKDICTDKSKFFKSFKVPNGFKAGKAKIDDATGLYKVNISIKYYSGVALGNKATHSKRQQITFTANLQTCAPGVTCTRYLSTVPINTDVTTRNYSTLGPAADDLEHYDTQRFGFGRACNDTDPTPKALQVHFYDVDNGSTWRDGDDATNTYFRIERQKNNGGWTALNADDYSLGGSDSGGISYDPANPTSFRPDDGSATDSFVTVKLQPRVNYRASIGPIWTGNLLGVGLPTDTIFGDLNCDYALTPHTTTNDSLNVVNGDTRTVQSSVTRDVHDATSIDTSWWITELVAPRPLTVDDIPEYSAGGDTCAAAGAGGIKPSVATSCTNSTAGWRTHQVFTSLNTTRSISFTADAPIGSYICFVTSINPPGSGQSGWRNSEPPLCFVVGKTPKVQVWGGDLRTRGQIDVSTTTTSGKLFGSWVEYGSFSVGKNNNFGSGSSLASGADPTSRPSWSELTFANVTGGSPSTPNYGNYTLPGTSTASIIQSYSAEPLVGTPSGPNLDLNSLVTSGRYKVSSTVNLTGGSIPAGRWIVIDATGQTVTINGNITYASSGLNNPSDLPQVIILANNIRIAEGVTQVDAWLVASSTINTCSTFANGNPNGLRTTNCESRLTVNGPVATQKLYLYRTAGSDAGAVGEPAEVFNLRADAYLWAYAHSTATSVARTVYSVELPPRF